ncbi:hypothetical protein BDR06DRAFT_977616 [Suillus hirtellus]|nr:hypothetical protein BDR06DRAFT_977616 [Suillus hirtellus]
MAINYSVLGTDAAGDSLMLSVAWIRVFPQIKHGSHCLVVWKCTFFVLLMNGPPSRHHMALPGMNICECPPSGHYTALPETNICEHPPSGHYTALPEMNMFPNNVHIVWLTFFAFLIIFIYIECRHEASVLHLTCQLQPTELLHATNSQASSFKHQPKLFSIMLTNDETDPDSHSKLWVPHSEVQQDRGQAYSSPETTDDIGAGLTLDDT